MRIVEGDWVPLPATVESRRFRRRPGRRIDDAGAPPPRPPLGRRHCVVAVGGEDGATAFYAGVLGFTRVPKPEHLAARGGCWFEAGDARVHLGVDPDFRPARKAHPALLVRGLAALVDRLRGAGVGVTAGEGQFYVDDPFGNRVELLEQGGTLLGPP